jgi:hypothetical protein
LLSIHAGASKSILTNIPEGATTQLHNSEKKIIAEIDKIKNEVHIHDLKETATFLNKKNINNKAENAIGLLYNESTVGTKENNLKAPSLATHPLLKANAVLDLVPKNEKAYKFSQFTVILNDEGKEYAKLSMPDEQKNIEFTVTDQAKFKSILKKPSQKSLLLKNIVYQVSQKDKILNKEKLTEEMVNVYNDTFKKNLENACKKVLTKDGHSTDISDSMSATSVSRREIIDFKKSSNASKKRSHSFKNKKLDLLVKKKEAQTQNLKR